MGLFLFLLSIFSFIFYFYAIGLWYLSFLPIIFLVWFLSYYGLTHPIKIKSSEFFEKYSLYIAWIIILFWLFGVLNFFDFHLVKVLLILISINLILRIFSYFIDYKDWKSVFMFWYYFCVLFLLIASIILFDIQEFFKIFSYLRNFNLSILAFFVYIVGLFKEVKKYMNYKLFIFWIGAIIIFFVNQISNIYVSLTLSILFLTGLFSFLFKILQYQPISQERKNISIRRILAGERITCRKKYFSSIFMENFFQFVSHMPLFVKWSLELMNILLMLVAIVNYFYHRKHFTTFNQLLYWVIIAFFIGNILILKKIKFNSLIQNLALFLVINFAFYLSLFSYFNGNVWSVVVWAIIRSIVSIAFMFYIPKSFNHLFDKRDYTYWTISIILITLLNSVLLMKTSLAWELIFFLILLYLGIQGMFLFYALKYVMNLDIRKIEK